MAPFPGDIAKLYAEMARKHSSSYEAPRLSGLGVHCGFRVQSWGLLGGFRV